MSSMTLFSLRREGSYSFVGRIHVDPGDLLVSGKVELKIENIKAEASYKMQIVAVPDSIWPKAI